MTALSCCVVLTADISAENAFSFTASSLCVLTYYIVSNAATLSVVTNTREVDV